MAETFPEAWLEDPDLNDGTREVLAPHMARHLRRHSTRLPTSSSWHPSARSTQALALGSLEELFAVYEHCEREGLAIYSGGQGEVGVGRGQVQYLALALPPGHAERHRAVRLQRSKRAGGMPTSPMDPVPSETGYRWG